MILMSLFFLLGLSGSPSPAVGDMLYRDVTGWRRLPGNTSASLEVLTQTGDGVNSAPPVWAVTGTIYTDEQAQDAVGTILDDSGDIDFTYDDATPKITAVIKSDAISDAKLRNSGACSVIGRSANSSGDPADISAASNATVLKRSSNALSFAAVDVSTDVTGDLPFANLVQASAASKLVGRGSASGAGDFQEISLGSGLSMSSTTLSASGIIANSGGLIGIQTITTTGAYTYTPTSGTNSVVIDLQGAGGGGGALAQPTGTNVSEGQGGGGGAWLRVRLTANFSGGTGSVGAKGTGGSAGANDGTAGGDTTFIDTAGSPTTYTAAGGAAGLKGSAVASPHIRAGALGGTATNGTLSASGGAGLFAASLSQIQQYGSTGGTAMYGTPARAAVTQVINTCTAGGNATGKGAGGGGAVGNGTGSAAAGGDGADGVVIIWEFS